MTVPYSIPASDGGVYLGAVYNQLMQVVSSEWIGFMDHDIQLVSPHWYELFKNAIEEVGDKAGYIGCVTNRVGCPLQRVCNIKNTNDIAYHKTVAEEIYEEYGNELQDVTDSRWKPSALVFITSKKAWKDIGGFKVQKSVIGIDTNYVGRLKEKGYRIYLLKGLYVYHWYRGLLQH